MRWWSAATLSVGLALGCDGQVRFDADDTGAAEDSAVEAAEDTGPAKCEVDEDCPFSSLHCDPDTKQCVPCLVDLHCAAHSQTPRCDVAHHTCVECNADKECGSDGRCDANRCLRRCFDADDCAFETPACNPTRNVCTCTSSSCGSTERPRCETTIGICVQCVGDGDCKGDRHRCVRGECVDCTVDADCAGKRCDPVRHDCVD
jgi:hypothetical protein